MGNVLMRQLCGSGRGRNGDVPRRLPYEACVELVVIGGRIVAPPKDNLILPGITYDATMEFAREAGVPLNVRPVPKAEALAADEMWLSSSTKEVLAITTVDGQPFAGGKPGPVFRRMWEVFGQKPKHTRALEAQGARERQLSGTTPRIRSGVKTSPLPVAFAGATSPMRCGDRPHDAARHHGHDHGGGAAGQHPARRSGDPVRPGPAARSTGRTGGNHRRARPVYGG
jgi:hypothetical protein